MPGDKKHKPRAAAPGRLNFISAETYKALTDRLDGGEVNPDPEQFNVFRRGGKTFFRLRGRETFGRGPGSGGGGRFIPSVGGASSDRLFISPGTVTFCRIGNEDRDPGEDEEGQQTTPEFPQIEGTAINHGTPPSFAIGAKTGASVWLCTSRKKCGSVTASRLEMLDRGDKPERVPGELHRLLCSMDFETGSGGEKSITNLDSRIESDVEVWYICLDDDSSGDPPGSSWDSDLNSEDESDDPNNPSDSTSDENCPWAVQARWYNKANCYPRYPPNGSVMIGILIEVSLTRLFHKCKNWHAYITVNNGGRAARAAGQEYGPNPGELKVPITAPRQEIQARFYFTNPPCNEMQTVTIRLQGEQKGEPSPEHECCEVDLGPRTIEIGNWPGWCGESCTTLVPTP